MQTIVHVIDSLGRGGTETLLMDLLPSLARHYNIVLVSLDPKNEFGDGYLASCKKYYCLHHKGPASLFTSVRRLKKIINEHQPVLVRSQLVMSTIISRLACPPQVPLVFSIHNTLSVLIKKDIAGRVVRLLEKKVRRKNTTLIGVTRSIISDYISHFSYEGQYQVLYNYVRDDFFNLPENRTDREGSLRLVAVGNLRYQKNYPYLIEAFKQLKDTAVELDIYGDGELKDELEREIAEHRLNINLKGKVPEVHKILKHYDAFVMVSTFEGFGIAVAEAMAAGMPLLLSDIEVFREITRNNALFVDPALPASFVSAIRRIVQDKTILDSLIEVNRKIAQEDYSRGNYLKKLLSIYDGVLTERKATLSHSEGLAEIKESSET